MIHKFSRYLLTLVALLAMTTGAWADDSWHSSQSQESNTVTLTNITVTFNGDWTFTNDLAKGNSNGQTITIAPTAAGDFTLIFGANIPTSKSFNMKDADNNELTGKKYSDPSVSVIGSGVVIASGDGVIYALEAGKTYTFFVGGATWSLTSFTFEVKPSGPEVTISDDQTEAEFDMPSYDATLEYDIVRNLASNMTVSIGDGQDGYRIRVKKQGESFVPAEITFEQMMALYTVHDATEQKDLLFYGDGKVCDISIFAVDDQGQPTGDAIDFTALTPGRYVAIATAPDDSELYAGQTPQSNIFVLYQGYEVTVPAGEYITYYKDEALYVENEYAKLYTITDVSETTATATELTVAPTLTPILVQNTAQTPQNILLIPTTDKTPDAVEAYTGFIGTLEASTIAASTATADRYAFNGKQFVWVKDAIEVGANKAWLEISNSNARVLTLVFGESTGVNEVIEVNGVNDNSLYDLNGRKINMPTKKGVYIMNGKKVVVK